MSRPGLRRRHVDGGRALGKPAMYRRQAHASQWDAWRFGPAHRGCCAPHDTADALAGLAGRPGSVEDLLHADETADRFRLLFEQHPDAVFELDRDGRFVLANAAVERLTGHPIDELIGAHFDLLVDPDDVERAAAVLARSLAGAGRTFELRVRRRDGAPVHALVTTLPVGAGAGHDTVFCVARDVTEQRGAQAALATSEQRFRGLFVGTDVAIAITALDGRFVDANPAFVDMLGYSLEELRETDFLSITHPDDRRENMAQFQLVATGEKATFGIEKRYLAKDGSTVWVRVSVSQIRDADGEPLHYAATAEDVTDRKRAEERLRRSESLRRLAGGLARVGGWAVDASDRRVHWSEEIYRILEAPVGEEPALDEIMALYPDDDRKRLTAALDACLADGTPFDLELQIDTFVGRRIPVRAIGEAELDDDGRVARAVGAFQDISELQAAGELTAQLAERLSTTFESMTDALYVLDREWRFTFLNSRAEHILHRTRVELLGRNVWDAFPEAVGSAVHDAYHRALETQTTQVVDEYYYEPLDSWFEVNAYPSEESLTVYFRDVSDERAARVALEEREAALARQAALLDEATDAIMVRDLDNTISFWSRGAERIYGWTADEAIGVDARELVHTDQVTFDRAMAALRRDGSWQGELVHVTKSGDERTIQSRWTLVDDADGRGAAVLSINTDVTEAKRTEQQFLRAQRMESLGTLASGIAHDLNNVLAPVLLAVDLLRAGLTDDDQVGLLDTIQSSARRGADLVAQVLSFARGMEGQHGELSIGQLLDDLTAIVRDTFPKDIVLDVRVDDDLPPVLGDGTQVQQVLLNLAVNARDAMPSGGLLILRADAIELDAQYVSSIPDAQPGAYVRIEVEDDGSGMPLEVRERVFEPFFSTKPHGVGTGLGLSTAAAIVRSHGGFVQVDSELGIGSRFRLYLPVAELAREPAASRETLADLPRGRGETVLVVDDEAAIRAMTRQTLEAHGYRVLEAGDGAEAVSMFVSNRTEIDVVLTDMTMPVMDGPAAIRAIRRADPDVRIVGASGLHDDGKVAQASAAGVRHFLPKPYSARRLLAALQDILNAPT